MSKRRSNIYRVYLNERVYIEPKLLASHILEIDPSYQRRIDMERVQKIVDNFNPLVVNPLKVSHRGGKYYVVDGGHTLMALKKVNEGKKTFLVECRVYENLTYEEENAMFSIQFGFSKPISVRDEMNALANAKDQETLDILRIIEESGLSLAIREESGDAIRAVGKVRSMYRKCGEEIFSSALVLIRDTWGGKDGSLTANIIGGVCLFLKEFGSEYSRERFVRKLKASTPGSIRVTAKLGRVPYQTLDAAVATAVASLYNQGNGKGRLDPVRASRVME